MNKAGKKLVVMIPCYNEEKTLFKVLRSIPKKIAGIAKIETLVIDDGSTDNSLVIAKKASANHLLIHRQNKGLGATFKDGMEKCLELAADVIVNLDGDGQFDSGEMVRLVEPVLKDEAGMVTGSRFLHKVRIKNMPFIRFLGNKIFTLIINNLTGSKFTDTQCGFRAYSREAALRLNLFGEFTYTQEVFLNLAEVGAIIKERPISVTYKKGRNSRISGSLFAYGKNSLGIITRAIRDIQPLKFFGVPAVIIALTGFFINIFMFIRFVILGKTSPFKSLIDVGIALIIIGVLVMFLALVADMQRKIRLNQEELLYLLKKQNYENKGK